MVGHLETLRRDIERCAISYNRLLGSMEKRVLVSARKFRKLGISGKEEKELQRPESVDTPLRKPNTDRISES
jgi:DNA recombination protein RmuC